MVKIEDIAEEFTTGKLKLRIEKDGKDYDFEIIPTQVQKNKLMFINRQLENNVDVENSFQKQSDIIKEMLIEAYPNFTEKQIENLVVKFGDYILLELSFVWEWRSREAWEVVKAKQKEEIQKVMKSDESSIPEKETSGTK